MTVDLGEIDAILSVWDKPTNAKGLVATTKPLLSQPNLSRRLGYAYIYPSARVRALSSPVRKIFYGLAPRSVGGTAMSIIRSPSKRRFTCVNNILLEDIRLTWQARGIFAYIISKPDNWNVQVPHLTKQGNLGRDGIYSALKNLETYGYIGKRLQRDEQGRIIGTDWVFYDTPEDNPDFDQPVTPNPHPLPSPPSVSTVSPHPDKPDTGKANKAAEPYAAEPDTAEADALVNTEISTTTELKDSPEGKPSGGSPCLPAKFDSGKPCNLIQLPSPASDANASSQPPKKSRTLSPEMQNACRATWEAYSAAYFARYGAEPVRNAKVNRNVIDLVKRLGMKEAPHVAAWFLTHNAGYYVKTGHSMGALLSDAEKLRTEWATGHRMTDTKARQTDRAGTTANYVQEILAERRAKS